MMKKKLRKTTDVKKLSNGRVTATASGDNCDNVELQPSNVNKDTVISSHCPHITSCQNLKSDDIRQARQKSCCDVCCKSDKGLWLCMSDGCGKVLCGSKVKNHSDEHFKKSRAHPLQLSLRSDRVWCFLCDYEVLLYSNVPAFPPSSELLLFLQLIKALTGKGKDRCSTHMVSSNKNLELMRAKEILSDGKFARTFLPIRGRMFNDHGEVRRAIFVGDNEEHDEDDFSFSRGLTGLCNLGNTCYMNAALQALSNCLPLAEYFRSVSSLAPFAAHPLSTDYEPPLSRAFRTLLQTIWSRNRNGFTNPQALLHQMRVHCPQFRGWGQQDAQEFIRCFLDLIHRELRQPVYSHEEHYEKLHSQVCEERNNSPSALNSLSNKVTPDKAVNKHPVPIRRNSSSSSSSHCSNSLDRYETADSGWSSDGDACSINATTTTSSLERGKRCRSVSPNALEQVRSSNMTAASEMLNSDELRKDRNFASTYVLIKIYFFLCSINLEAPKLYRSIVNDVFDGQLRSTVKCFTCQHISETYETFQDLSLCIPTKEQLERLSNCSYGKDGSIDCDSVMNKNSSKRSWLWWLGLGWLWSFYGYLYGTSITLIDTLNAFFSPDDLRDENMYSCEKCAKLRNGVKMCRITRLPEVLCIHLKRFRHDSSYSTKVSTNVSFPLYDLDLSPFYTPMNNSNDIPAVYDLCAFVTHRGTSAESGHYLAYCKNEYDNNWYEFDDTVVTKLETADVLTKEAYVLFYQRKTTDEMQKIKGHVGTLLEQERLTDGKKISLPHYYVSREWLHRLSTFSYPGPISNYDFLCRHAQILPRKAANLVEHYAVVESSTWEYMFEKFGGGPVCSELHYCSKCQKEYLWLQHKRDFEFKAFKAIENQSRQASSLFPKFTYSYYLPSNAISKSWLLKWRSFVDGEFPPGPIDNRSLLVRSNNGALYLTSPTNYVELCRELWLFFHSIYGGGPEVFCVSGPHPSQEEVAEMIAEVEPEMKKAQLLKMKEAECCSDGAVNNTKESVDDSFGTVREVGEASCCSEVATASSDNLLM
uniref:ubiquitinyl hydrolase 1 n=1 Tax=Syphacia muris TaxID=451379 RepID=A0A158R3V6_9BILA